MKPIVTWILIADAGSAKVVENRGPGKGLSQLEGMVFQAPAGNAHADQEGRSFDSGSPARNKLEAHHGMDQSLRDFITSLVDILENGHNNNQYDRLVICAAPNMLGELRKGLPASLKSKVIAEIPKDLTNTHTEDLPRHFEDVLIV